jgi:hypothetical protein
LKSPVVYPGLVPHPINGLVVEKQQSRLTLQKATKVVEGKMYYILPDFFAENNSYILLF